jgi:acyl-CoA thioesterase-1
MKRTSIIKQLNQVLLVTLLLLGTAAQVFAEKPSSSPVLLVWGDSLSAAYGMPREQGWVSLLAERLQPMDITLINGSISGETTHGGLARLPAALAEHRPDFLLIELGGNDGLRGIPAATMKRNLREMIQLAKNLNIRVLLLGMKIPPNYGLEYSQQFEQVYAQLAEESEVALLPFFLEGVATNFDLMQHDGIHPNGKAQAQLLENVWPAVEKMIVSPLKLSRP